jgi:pseudouridine-5'-phosphate glycosidase
MLDIDLTLEYLETSGVPVLGWGTTELAGFYARSSGRTLAGSVADARAAAQVAAGHWSLGIESGLVICAPLPEDAALPAEEAESAIAQATADAAAAGIHGPAATAYTLARVAELTQGRSVKANLALIENNASIGAQIAAALAR